MLTKPLDVLEQFPVRKAKMQKQAFRDSVQSYLRSLGYRIAVEEGWFGSRNLVIGDPEHAKVLVTAHYDTPAKLPIPNLLTPFSRIFTVLYSLTAGMILLLPPMLISLAIALGICMAYGFSVDTMDQAVFLRLWTYGFTIPFFVLTVLSMVRMYVGPANRHNANDNTSGVVTLLEIARTMPENQRHKVCFVLFDLEEAGLLGSWSYRKAHKEATDRQLVLNLDCVGDGDHIRMFPTPKLKQNRKKLTELYKACGYFGPKSILVHEKGYGRSASDHKRFLYGVGICALRKGKWGYYLGRIHTPKDTILDSTNVNLLRAALTTYISQMVE